MRRVLAVAVIGVLMTLSLGIDQVSWAGQDGAADRQARRARVLRALAGLRPGSTVEIEWADHTKVKAVIDDIGADSIRALVEEPRKPGAASPTVTTRTIPIDDILSIRAVRVGRANRVLIAAAVVAGLIALVGVCAAAING